MTEDCNEAKVSSSDSAVTNDASQTRQRRKRKWDQPAALIAAGVTLPQLLTLNNTINVPAMACLNTVSTRIATMAPLLQTFSVPSVVPKFNQVNNSTVLRVFYTYFRG